jgi:hypothetical protein
MGMEKNIYLGPYIKIKSMRTIEESMFACMNEDCESFDKKSYRKNGDYCPHCGNVISDVKVPKQVPFNIHGFCDDKFNDEDMFTSGRGEGGGDHEIVIPNRRSSQGGIDLDDEPNQHNFLKMSREDMLADLARDDWKSLILALTADEIEYEIGWGVVTYWW